MLAFLPIGGQFERQLGTVKFSYLIGLIVVLADFTHILLAYLISTVGTIDFLNRCGVGLSGVIFGLINIHAHQSNVAHYSIFGLFTVPAKAYAWCLLVFLQLFIPNASFIGHLSGVLVGQVYVWNLLWFAVPSDAFSTKIERSVCATCTQRFNFIPLSNTTTPLPHYTDTGGRRSSFNWSSLFRFVSGVGESEAGSRTTGTHENADGIFPGEPQYIRAPASAQLQQIPVIVETEDDFTKLVQMGFDEPSVRAALLASDGDFITAMNKLTGTT